LQGDGAFNWRACPVVIIGRYCMPLSKLNQRQHDLLAGEFPKFSATEMKRRRTALAQLMAAHQLDALVLYGAHRSGSAIQWITNWPVTAEGCCIFVPGERDTLFVEYFNHVPLASQIANDTDVRPGDMSIIDATIAELKRRSVATNRLGVIGPLGISAFRKLEAAFGELTGLGKDYVGLRLVKSDEEIDWLTIGAAFSDQAIAAMQKHIIPGMSEYQLAALVEEAYVPLGGTTHIHYFGISSMSEPRQYVPSQYARNRVIQSGDVVFCEISAAFWGYTGQVLRSFTIDAEPTPLYQDLYQTAQACYNSICGMLRDGVTPQEVVATSAIIEKNGFTTCDDLVHGYGGGYLPPILGSASRPAGPLPEINFEAGMTVVVQPNVISLKHNAGVQLGDLVLIGRDGVTQLHHASRDFLHLAP
jgi:Xaa-Pro aminopeptidase